MNDYLNYKREGKQNIIWFFFFQIFLDYTKAGSSFVFGDLYENIFAFQVSNEMYLTSNAWMGLFLLLNVVAQYSQALPIVVFFSSVMSVLYYLGVMQWVITKVKVTKSSLLFI